MVLVAATIDNVVWIVWHDGGIKSFNFSALFEQIVQHEHLSSWIIGDMWNNDVFILFVSSA